MIRIFSNEGSVMRLLGILLMEKDEIWITGKRHFDLEQY